MNSEGVQVDMVTVRTIIKGLCRWFEASGCFKDILLYSWLAHRQSCLTVTLLMSALWGDSVREDGKFKIRAERPGWGCLDLVINYQSEGVIAERRHYWREFWSINDFILRNWGAWVDTIFGHVSLDTYLELMRGRSASRKMVAGLQMNCRWGYCRWESDGIWLNPGSSDEVVPMTSNNGWGWR